MNLSTQLLARFLTFVAAGWALAPAGSLAALWSPSAAPRTLGLGAITLAHVFTSYLAFGTLPAGVAMSLFYTYPVFNLIGGVLGFGEKISLVQGILVAVAIAGVVLVSLGTRDDSEGAENPEVNWKGVAAGLAAALTETLMYFAVRTAKETNPYFSMVELYSGALVGMLGLLTIGAATTTSALRIEGTSGSWIKMLLFNTLIGFVGYSIRFFAIPQMSTVAFSLLSLVGVIASFGWGLAFVSEVPNALSISGATLIALAAAFTDKK